MITFWQLLYRNRSFYLPYLILVILVGVLQIGYSQNELMQWVNSRHTPTADLFFTYATYLGDGAFFAVIIVSLLWHSFRWAVKSLLVFLLTSLLAQSLKHTLFADHLRPVEVFVHQALPFRTIEGVEIAHFNSFPSGHSTSVFALFCLLTILVNDKRWGIVFLGLAALTAYSRLYLFQHFVEDIYAGSILGVVSTTVLFYALHHHWARYPQSWLDRSLRRKRP